MLTELYVENFALMEKVQVNFPAGLNVLTGETGTGKSLLIDAVGLLTGGRASQEMVRSGAVKATVSGTFSGPFAAEISSQLTESGLAEEDEQLILSREVALGGKNTCRINCRTVPLSLYRDIARRLVNIHGQHEQVALLEEDNQMLLLDSYGGSQLAAVKTQVQDSFSRLESVRHQLRQIAASGQDNEQKKEFLRFQLREIEQAQLQPEEEEALQQERNILQHAEKLNLETGAAYEKLYGGRQKGAQDLLNEAAFLVQPLAGIDVSLRPLGERLAEMGYLLEDLVREIAAYRENIIADPVRLDLVERRLQEISKLRKKYGNSVPEILAYGAAAREQLELLEHQAENSQELERLLAEETSEFRRLADSLSALRLKAAEKLTLAVTEQLRQLQMTSASFLVRVEDDRESGQGTDKVVFLISPNPGEELKPVARIASGGEMSRIMLAIKVILADLDRIPTLIFDEIDSGLGGRAVDAVGEKLALVSNSTQVFCVTHSPVTASFADNHLSITKETIDGRTRTRVDHLSGDQVLQELSRMLAGDKATQTTLNQARELLAAGRRQEG